MTSLLIYAFLAVLTLAFPLKLHKHPTWIVLGASLGEFVIIVLIYASSFILCTDPDTCGSEWASWAIPVLIATMNIGMIWPILAGYEKRADLQKENEDSITQDSESPGK